MLGYAARIGARYVRYVAGFLLAALAIDAAPLAAAERYPSRPVRIVIPSGAGGITDILGRVIAQKLTDSFGQQVIIDNRPGASGIVGSQIVAKAAPDGYTLLMAFPSHAVNPSLYASMPYDTVKAFAPVTLVSAVSAVLVVPTELPARSVQELIALSKDKSLKINYGSVGRGSLGHLSSELLRSMTGMNITHISYKGSPQIMTALLSGEIQLYLIASAGTVMPHLKSGRLRALGVSATKRIPSLPDVPPIAETVPGYEARGWNGILGPAGTPRAIVDRLHNEIVLIVQSPEFNRQVAIEGAIPVGNTPAEFAAVIKADIDKWAKVVKEAGIRPE
jgi:tripartite-type tricarboxylate transporter receptor subunit TctC